MNIPDEKNIDKIRDDANSANARIIRWICGFIIFVALFVSAILFDKNIKFLFPQNWDIRLVGTLKYGIIAIFLCCLLCLYRIMMGPTAPDRAVSLDMVGTLIVGFCAIMGIVTKRGWYIDIGIIWALQSFIGSLALAKYLEGRQLDE